MVAISTRFIDHIEALFLAHLGVSSINIVVGLFNLFMMKVGSTLTFFRTSKFGKGSGERNPETGDLASTLAID